MAKIKLKKKSTNLANKIYAVTGKLKKHKDFERTVYVKANSKVKAKKIAGRNIKDTSFVQSDKIADNVSELDPDEIKSFKRNIAVFAPESIE